MPDGILWNRDSEFTLQCDTWLWDDMPLNLPKRPPYWNSTYGFHFHTSPQSTYVIMYQSAKFYPNRTTLGRKNDVMPIFKMADLSHLGFYGSHNGFFEKPNCIPSYRSSIDIVALNCLVFEKIAFPHFGVKIQDGGSPPSWILVVQ